MTRRVSARSMNLWRLRRLGFLRPLLVALIGISACSPAARIYSVYPVDREGNPLDVTRIDLILFDDGTRRPLLPGETLSLVGKSLVIEGPVSEDGSRTSLAFGVDAVESVRQPLADGTQHWIEIRTPADLAQFDTLPRIQSIETSDGKRIDLDGEPQRSAHWSADRLAIVIENASGSDPVSIPLDSIARVELFVPDALGSTLASPAFWIVGAAAAGLAIWIAGAQDEDTLATN